MISQIDIEDMAEDAHIARQAAALDDPQVRRDESARPSREERVAERIAVALWLAYAAGGA